ncbi:Transcriptional regulator, partial [Fulvia fulva]
MNDQQTEPRQRRAWTAGEDSTLYHEVRRTGIYQGTSNDWNAVAAKLPRRTNKDCRKRWLKICKLVNKGTWSTEEDERLLEAVEEHGQSWIQVAQMVETRHADQCAKRWHTVLCQSGMEFTHAWNSQNDEYLLHAVELYGRKWRLIAEQYFQGRSAADVRNRW